jgi:hypothetical protein
MYCTYDLCKSVKSFSQKTILQVENLKKIGFLGKTFFECTFTTVICTFLKSVWKDGFFDISFDLIKEKKFPSHSRVSVYFLWTKKSKWKQPLNISENSFL